MAELIAIDDLMADINSQWNASNVTKPALITVNGANEPKSTSPNSSAIA